MGGGRDGEGGAELDEVSDAREVKRRGAARAGCLAKMSVESGVVVMVGREGRKEGG